MMNIIIWATQYDFHSSRMEVGHSWITRAAIQTRNISPLEPTGVAKLFESMWLHWENVKEALPCSQPQRHHFWCPPSKESYQSFAVFSCWSLMKAECYRLLCRHDNLYKWNAQLILRKIWCTAAPYNLLGFPMRISFNWCRNYFMSIIWFNLVLHNLAQVGHMCF